jgi:hypothetical protein
MISVHQWHDPIFKKSQRTHKTKLLELMNKFIKFARYKSNTQKKKQLYFYTTIMNNLKTKLKRNFIYKSIQ